jgi:hypothetical protein
VVNDKGAGKTKISSPDSSKSFLVNPVRFAQKKIVADMEIALMKSG